MVSRRTTTPKKTIRRTAASQTDASPAQNLKLESPRVRVDPATRYNLIARAAYLRAEKRGFAPGGEMQDWLEAEAEIERLLGA